MNEPVAIEAGLTARASFYYIDGVPSASVKIGGASGPTIIDIHLGHNAWHRLRNFLNELDDGLQKERGHRE